jgi:hypothetical protein
VRILSSSEIPPGKRNYWKDPVHINRLKIAHVRASDPAHCIVSYREHWHWRNSIRKF